MKKISLSKKKIMWLREKCLSSLFLIATKAGGLKLRAAYNHLSGILSMYVNCSPEAFSDDIRNLLGVDTSSLEWRQTNLTNNPVSYETAVIVTASSKA